MYADIADLCGYGYDSTSTNPLKFAFFSVMKNKNIILISLSAVVVFVALFIVFFPIFNREEEESFSFDVAKYEALAENHPVGEKLLGQLKQNAELLTDDNKDNDTDGYLGVAFFMRQFDENADAILAYKEALRRSPENTLALNNVATSYRDIGDYKSAEEAYRKILEISPGDSSAYINVADTYLVQRPEDEEGLLEIMQPGIDSVLNPGDILSYLGVFYRDRGNLGKAIEYFEEFLKYNPDSVPVQSELEELRSKL